MPKTKQFGVTKQPGDAGAKQRQAPASTAPPPGRGGHAVRGGFEVPPDSRKTVMMQPFEAPSEVRGAHAAPEIELVQHAIPREGPLDPRLLLLEDPDSDRAAAFRVLRHHLLERGHPQVIAVAGATERCGKTTTAVNLALALAECGRGKVLLVDANLRRPEIAGIFRFVPPWCFAEQLVQHREQPALPWSVVDVEAQWLHVLAVDPRSEHTHRIDAPSFATAMERLRLANYDHIVVDCPSVLGSADVNLIQDAADGVLLCARAKEATARDVRRAVEQLSPTKILGSTLLE